jgi:hypothetical protein
MKRHSVNGEKFNEAAWVAGTITSGNKLNMFYPNVK